MSKKGNPFWNFVKKAGVAILLLLWVILPDFLPLLVDDVAAFIGAIVILISSFGDFVKAIRM